MQYGWTPDISSAQSITITGEQALQKFFGAALLSVCHEIMHIFPVFTTLGLL